MTTFFTDRGMSRRVGVLIAEGGEGRVYNVVGAPSLVAKIYHADSMSVEKSRKIQAMVQSPVRDPTLKSLGHHSIAWVESLLYLDAAGTRFAGYTMPLIDRRRFAEGQRCYEPDDRVATFGVEFSWKHLLQTASNLCSCIAAVHREGHRVGDLGGRNFLVDRRALVSLIDCDSFEIHDKASGATYPTTVGTSEWLPPELLLAGPRGGQPIDRYYADLFALAVLLFKFVMLGVHPYARAGGEKGRNSVEAATLAGLFPYGSTGKNLRPPTYAPTYKIVPPSIRRLFGLAFVTGHGDPTARPAAEQWHRALQREIKDLRQCSKNKVHFFGGHLRSCPWHQGSGRTHHGFAAGDAFPTVAPARRSERANGRRAGVGVSPSIKTPPPAIKAPSPRPHKPPQRTVAKAPPPAFKIPPLPAFRTLGSFSPPPSAMSPTHAPASVPPSWPPQAPTSQPASSGIPPMPSLITEDVTGVFLKRRRRVRKEGLQWCRRGRSCDLGFFPDPWLSREGMWMQPGFFVWDKGQNALAGYPLDESGWESAWRYFSRLELGQLL
jgi:serine/threonine protein kinase